MLVNDLDLRVIRNSNGTEHRPYKLDPSNPGSQTVLRGDNERDNVEQVFISDPASGATYTVRVSHDGSLNGFSQDFGLVVTGNTSLTLTGGGGDQDPLSVTLSGPSKLDSGENGTWTASVTGGSGSTSYDWEYQSPGSNTWKSASCSGPDCTRSFSNNDDQAKTARIRVTVTKGNETDTAAQTVEVRPGTLPLEVTLSGPGSVSSGYQGTWYAQVDGGVGSTSYSWEINPTFVSYWTDAYCSGSSCTTSFYNSCGHSKQAEIRVTVSKKTQTETASQTVYVSGAKTYSTGDVTTNAPPCSITKTASTAEAAGGIRLAGSSLQVEEQTEGAVRLSWWAGRSRLPSRFVVEHRAGTTGAWLRIGAVAAGDSAGVDAAGAVAYRFRARDLRVGTHQFRLAVAPKGKAGAKQTTAPVTAHVEMDGAYRLRAYPNPVRERATVELTVKEAQDVTVAVYDLLGRRVTTLHDGPLPVQETRRFRLNASEAGLPSGTYFLRVRGESFVATKRLTVVQ